MALTIPIMDMVTEDTMILITHTMDMADIMADTMEDITPTMVAHTGTGTATDTGTPVTILEETIVMEGLTTGTITDTPAHPMRPMEALRALPTLTPDTGAAPDQLHLPAE